MAPRVRFRAARCPHRPALPQQRDLARGGGAPYTVQCSQIISGPNGHDGGDSEETPYENPKMARVEVLRAFADDLAGKVTLRTAARLFGLKREALRKFTSGETKNPRLGTRRAINEVYQRYQRGGATAVREAKSEVPLPTPDEFRAVFKDREDAHRKFAELFARVPPDDEGQEPVWAEIAHDYVKRLVNAAFASEPVTYRTRARSRSAGHDEGEAAKKKTPAKKAAGKTTKKGDKAGAKKKPPAKPRKKKTDGADGDAASGGDDAGET